MEPIETEYKGYRFRSRLEARWAVFFESVGADWTYEPEGFEFSSGGRWLPDFYIADCDTYVEIKPTEEGVRNVKPFSLLEQKWPGGDLSEEQAEDAEWVWEKVVVICGEPRVLEPQPQMGEDFSYNGHVLYDQEYRWCICPDCGSLGIQFGMKTERMHCGCDARKGGLTPCDRLLAAYDDASKARFEHGENGAV